VVVGEIVVADVNVEFASLVRFLVFGILLGERGVGVADVVGEGDVLVLHGGGRGGKIDVETVLVDLPVGRDIDGMIH